MLLRNLIILVKQLAKYGFYGISKKFPLEFPTRHNKDSKTHMTYIDYALYTIIYDSDQDYRDNLAKAMQDMLDCLRIKPDHLKRTNKKQQKLVIKQSYKFITS